jgi:hypothetical protein
MSISGNIYIIYFGPRYDAPDLLDALLLGSRRLMNVVNKPY